MSTVIVVFKAEVLNRNSEVSFAYQIAGESWKVVFIPENLP
jgi:hypothetical protein